MVQQQRHYFVNILIFRDDSLIPIQIIFATHQNILEGMAVPVPLQSVAFFFLIGIT